MNQQPWKIKTAEQRQRNRRPPFFGTKKDFEFYREHLLKVKNSENSNLPKNALILGATPELRDMVLDEGFNCYTVDLSKHMVEKLSLVMKNKDHPKEHILIKNWLEMDFDEGFFGIIMGDASFLNLATKADNEKLAGILFRQLAKGGYLVTRQVVLPEDYKPIQKKELIQLYRNKKISWPDFFMELRFWTYLDEVYDKETYQFDVMKNYSLIKQDFEEGLLTEAEFNSLAYAENDIINTLYPKREFILMLERNKFRFIKEFIDKKYKHCRYLTMFVFEK